MIGGLIGGIFLREIPRHLAGGVTSGQYSVFGSVIRNVASGQIVGFLQEAAPLANIALSGPLGLARAAITGGQLVQGEIIRSGVKRAEQGIRQLAETTDRIKLDVATLQKLDIANLAISAVGIGISVAGFALIAARIDGVKHAVLRVSDQIEALNARIDQMQQDALDADFADVEALAKALDEGWQLSAIAAEARWLDVSHQALSLQSRFERRTIRLLEGSPAHYRLAEPMLDALSMAGGLRVAALAASGHTEAALAAGADCALGIERLTGSIGLSDLVRVEMATQESDPGSQGWNIAMTAASEAARPTILRIRQREAASATRTALLEDLQSRGMHPRDWLESAREEKDVPVLLMLKDSASLP